MFDSCVVKLTSVCNLDCDYCYMFNLDDQTYDRVPNYMPAETALRLLDRIEEHAERYGKDSFKIVLHGGEPTLWPTTHYQTFLDRVDATRSNGLDLKVGYQTNGLKLPPEFLELMREYDVSGGISLDGPKRFNDRHRVDHSGRGSYERIIDEVTRALSEGYDDVINGFLSVAQPDIPPREYLSWVESLPLQKVDVLWPIEYHHDNPPWEPGEFDTYRERPRYGTWFADLFRTWWEKDDPDIYIRLFYEVLTRILGSKSHIDAIANDRLNMFVVNTDGQIEYPDYLRNAADGSTRTPYSLDDHALGDLADDSLFARLIELGDHRAPTCDECPVNDLCGGGFLPGRMTEEGIALESRSVLCPDEYYFFATVYDCLKETISGETVSSSRVVPFEKPLPTRPDSGREDYARALPIESAS